MAREKKATKQKVRARRRIAESVGPERGRVRAVAAPREEDFILEEAREVREKRHAPLTKGQIVAIGLARSRGVSVPVPPRGPKGKSRVKEHSANAFRKGGGRRSSR